MGSEVERVRLGMGRRPCSKGSLRGWIVCCWCGVVLAEVEVVCGDEGFSVALAMDVVIRREEFEREREREGNAGEVVADL